MKTITKILLCVMIGVATGFTCQRIYSYYQEHKCDNPYKQVCVKSHTITKIVPVFVNINGRTQMQMRPAIIRVCDEYETVLKDGCSANAERS